MLNLYKIFDKSKSCLPNQRQLIWCFFCCCFTYTVYMYMYRSSANSWFSSRLSKCKNQNLVCHIQQLTINLYSDKVRYFNRSERALYRNSILDRIISKMKTWPLVNPIFLVGYFLVGKWL